MIRFISDLPPNEIRQVKKSHERMLKNAGFYSNEEIKTFLDEIENEKLLNLQDAISATLYKKLYKKYFTKN